MNAAAAIWGERHWVCMKKERERESLLAGVQEVMSLKAAVTHRNTAAHTHLFDRTVSDCAGVHTLNAAG